MSNDYRAELQRLVQAYDDHGGRWPQHHEDALHEAVEAARPALAQPEPEGVTDAASRVAHYLEQRRLIRGLDPEVIHALHAGTDEPRQVTLTASDLEALTHFARPTIEPVPVYERWLQAVAEELAKAQAKHPEWPTDPLHAIAIIGEEFGELTQAVLQVTYEPGKSLITDVQREAVQTAAMALRFLQSMDAYVYADDTNTHRQDNALPVPGAEVG
jgi:hypothetical protein